LCDEPTSNVDVSNDEKVHHLLLGLPNTVLMICHRLHSIARFDKVMVLHDGRVLEQGCPRALLADSASALSELCSHAGIEMSIPTQIETTGKLAGCAAIPVAALRAGARH
jgi:ABC-type multidrug transport system fused ATPase/permease subunit